ncbi:MAG: crossover junction endodeoxyribonuclease RuvC [Myxococcota bacterium]
MCVLGIDPGSTVTGYAVIRSARGRLTLLDSGCIRTSSKEPMGQRLATLHQGILKVIDRHTLDGVAIEAIFRHKSSESALRLGQARGVLVLAAALRGFEAASYNPMTVKKTVGAHGRSDKEALARVVGMLLGERPEGPTDVTDAVAIAITHCRYARSRVMAGAGGET